MEKKVGSAHDRTTLIANIAKQIQLLLTGHGGAICIPACRVLSPHRKTSSQRFHLQNVVLRIISARCVFFCAVLQIIVYFCVVSDLSSIHSNNHNYPMWPVGRNRSSLWILTLCRKETHRCVFCPCRPNLATWHGQSPVCEVAVPPL